MTLKTSPGYAEYKRRKRLRQRFGLSVEDYEAMKGRQSGVCAICRKPETGINNSVRGRAVRRLSVDHSHGSGRVRGLLCHACNKGLGFFGDNEGLLRAAADYLAGHAVAPKSL